ncbi:MATH domain and coiled-coil domain-containing protein [Cardamine amara subsp. amara]|uniref:MATH domain and coiled-coil domain-containing protein n=1 Tax=Cardamine amara subsp. amara TaxID=228776 RepID=A0ABD1BZ00_CARAN
MWNQKPIFRFEIDNFSEKKDDVVSQKFVSDGCEWSLYVYPKGDELSIYVYLTIPSLLQPGLKGSVIFYLTVLNQSDKELYRSPFSHTEYGVKFDRWVFRKNLPLSNFYGQRFLEEDRLIIELYSKILEDVDGESGDSSEKEEAVYINGFRVFASQVTSVRKIFAEHPDIAVYVNLKNQEVKTEYMNVLLGLVNTLNKPSQNIAEKELRNAQSELNELTRSGFKLDLLKTKFDMVHWEKTKSYDAAVSRVQQLEERVKNLEEMESNLKRKLDEVELERKKQTADEPRIKNLEMMDSLKSKFEDVFLEKKKSYDAVGSRVQELEESVKDLKMMVSDLKAKLDKDEAESSGDGFLLVDM